MHTIKRAKNHESSYSFFFVFSLFVGYFAAAVVVVVVVLFRPLSYRRQHVSVKPGIGLVHYRIMRFHKELCRLVGSRGNQEIAYAGMQIGVKFEF